MLRQVINVVDGLNFEDYNDKHAFGDIYEKILKDLQSARDSGEFYTPRAVTDFVAQMEVVNFCGVFSIFHGLFSYKIFYY